MKTIRCSTCGRRIQVSRWPSRTGMAKLRHHKKIYHPTMMKAMTKKSLATKRKRGLINPRGKWYVGSNKYSRKGEIFESHFSPTQRTHGHLYLFVTGPFRSIEEAQKYKRGMDLA